MTPGDGQADAGSDAPVTFTKACDALASWGRRLESDLVWAHARIADLEAENAQLRRRVVSLAYAVDRALDRRRGVVPPAPWEVDPVSVSSGSGQADANG